MDKGLETDREFIKELVEWADMPPSRLAKESGLAATTVTRVVNGKATTRLSKPTIEKLQHRFRDFPHWPEEYRRTILSEVRDRTERPLEEKYGAADLPGIPLVGSAVAMHSFDPEHHVELTEIDMAEVLDMVRRPVSLARDNEAYAVTVVGESMWPRFRSGRRVIVSPRAPVSINDDVIVQLRGIEGDDEYRERVSLVLIKELVKNSPSFVELRQFNPDVTFRVERERIVAMHKVIGEVY
jgi:phage repressor protein C with HTH and peptisase S24 domain